MAELLITTVTEILTVPEIETLVLEIGIQGPPGPADDKHIQHDQDLASATWHIQHEMLKFPSVSVFDSTGEMVEGHVVHVSNKALRIEFSEAITGSAYLN